MHILPTSSASLDDLAEPVDLRQTPGEIVALSFTDSDLAGIAAAWRSDATLPSLRLAALRDLRHPMSVDLWIDAVARHAKVILVRILGGYEWWRYGCDQLAAVARARGIKLALLPGECREDDARLTEASTLPPDDLAALLACFREGGPDNMRVLARRLSALARGERFQGQASEVPKAGFYDKDRWRSTLPPIPILFYRSMLLASDVAPIDALADALAAQGLRPVPIYVSSLKDPAALAFVETALADLDPAAIVTATAFAAGAEPGAETLFDRAGVPVFQAITATTRRDVWQGNQRGLAPADLAMHVVLPELDGRILAGAISFKDQAESDSALGFRGQVNRPEPDRVELVALRIANHVRLHQTPKAGRKLAILMPDYPGAAGRSGYAVGLDVPNSVLAMLRDLKNAGYIVDGIPETSRQLLDLVEGGQEGLTADDYARLSESLPAGAADGVERAWGPFAATERFTFRAATFGNVTVALAPDRGRSADRRADYHDPALPPRHDLFAFGFWLRETLGVHAIVHVGAHGTLEWLPGKTIALTESCFPEIVTGALPVVYPFIVSNPGEAAQAKRRIAAVTLGHLPPPLIGAGLDENQQKLERLVDEYAQADGLDRRRRDRLAVLIVDTARETGLSGDAGVAATDTADEALRHIDAWLCDIKDFAVKDGLHVYGRAAPGESDPLRLESAEREKSAFLSALDGKHIAAGPSGAPARGRTDVLPTGRNLFTADPRTMPTPLAAELGARAADEILRDYLQSHGDWPRAMVVDLWGSASLRTGGEEIAQGLALMGCRPQWDAATGRVTGVEVLPPPLLGRPRVDVTFRISGLFRDMFPTQIALLDAAVRSIAARDEEEGENPLAAAARQAGNALARVFGSSPGTYGAGVEDLLADGDWQDRAEIGRAYLDATSHAYGGAEGEASAMPGAFAGRVADADLLVHTGDDPGRDILEGSADVAFIGGFAAAVAALGGKADVVVLDTTDPRRPRPRSVAQAVSRVVRARAVNQRFIAGQMRHGPRGASEFAETVDRLVGFAETTNAIPGDLIGAVHDAYLGDETVRAFLLRENPQAARLIARRLADARRRGLWHPLRNAVDDDLAALIAEAAELDSGHISPNLPPPLTPPRKGEGEPESSAFPSPLRGGVRGGGYFTCTRILSARGGGMTALAINRRGACPALAAPMPTGDGLLVRINPVAEGLSPMQLAGLAQASKVHGNGIVEVTARGSLQIRGLRPETIAALTADVAALGIVPRTGLPVEVGPLAGLDPNEVADPRPLAAKIRLAVEAAGLTPRLGPKVSVIVDGGAPFGLDEASGDVRLTAVRVAGAVVWRAAVAGTAETATPVAMLAEAEAGDFAMDLLGEIASRGIQARGRDIPLDGRSVAPPSVLSDISPTRGEIGRPQGFRQSSKLPISAHVGEMCPTGQWGRTEGGATEHKPKQYPAIRDGRIVVPIALPFGSIESQPLTKLADLAQTLGVTEFRLAPGRRLLALCDPAIADDLAHAAENLGFILDPGDPRLAVSACPGAPACASASFATRTAAEAIAANISPALAGTPIHISGCAKGCAHTASAPVTLVGSEKGVGLVANGTARDTPVAYVRPEKLALALARIGHLAEGERAQGETVAAVLSRLGPAQLAETFRQD